MLVDLYDDSGIPDDDASMYQDPEYWKWHYEIAAAHDRLDEMAEDCRLELTELGNSRSHTQL
ncbi:MULTISPECIES: hypothetical protein [Asticcacaulis]|jgi:hypothetical protein|uniref:hypothetical protein n=1 Tax=Asticcacaulis TaxID=76890 RepID=UPI001AE45991|nr:MULTISPECIES: hypothetical protein [Asticcacaulis]MBP2160525.1 hypothetical protein [Asticcacaulis solisilvae]MDR6801570.1 hypothetical protein [Asticcacaulis sp. BE141]